MLSPNAHMVLHRISNNINAVQEIPALDATLKRIDDISNADVEMQEALSEQSTVIVVDTNILLEFLDVLQTFVSEIEQQGLPVLLIIPGVVIYELDRYVARAASICSAACDTPTAARRTATGSPGLRGELQHGY